jgi:fatty-acid desaturase
MILVVVVSQSKTFSRSRRLRTGLHRCLRHRLHHVRCCSVVLAAKTDNIPYSSALPMILFTIRRSYQEWIEGNADGKSSNYSYAATRGLLFSHMGWIFFKPTYEKMELVDKEDLDNDPGA